LDLCCLTHSVDLERQQGEKKWEDQLIKD